MKERAGMSRGMCGCGRCGPLHSGEDFLPVALSSQGSWHYRLWVGIESTVVCTHPLKSLRNVEDYQPYHLNIWRFAGRIFGSSVQQACQGAYKLGMSVPLELRLVMKVALARSHCMLHRLKCGDIQPLKATPGDRYRLQRK